MHEQMSKVWVVSLMMIAAMIATLNAEARVEARKDEPRTSHFTCSLDIALRATDASASIVSGTTRSPDEAPKAKGSKIKSESEHHANLIGRGMANCKNQQGFQFNLPAVMAIEFDAEEKLPLEALRASLQPVSVESDVNKIFDQYTPHVELRNTPTVGDNASSDRTIIVKGMKNDVLMQINLNLPSEFASKVSVTKVDLKFDR